MRTLRMMWYGNMKEEEWAEGWLQGLSPTIRLIKLAWRFLVGCSLYVLFFLSVRLIAHAKLWFPFAFVACMINAFGQISRMHDMCFWASRQTEGCLSIQLLFVYSYFLFHPWCSHDVWYTKADMIYKPYFLLTQAPPLTSWRYEYVAHQLTTLQRAVANW